MALGLERRARGTKELGMAETRAGVRRVSGDGFGFKVLAKAEFRICLEATHEDPVGLVNNAIIVFISLLHESRNLVKGKEKWVENIFLDKKNNLSYILIVNH